MINKSILLFIIILGAYGLCVIQDRDDSRLQAGNNLPVQPNGFGGGEFTLGEHVPHLSIAERAEIEETLQNSITQLQIDGLYTPITTTGFVTLSWPLAPYSGLDDWGYHGISNFVDQDSSFPNQLLDYNCGQRTYDLSNGYNHQGIDFFTWPFGWHKMDDDEVAIVSAADGVIIHKADGNFDRSCSFGGSWNAVYVAHTDGSIAWYGHMKNGSLTEKGIGESVVTGEYLGVVGSSGSSTGPHLHMELYSAENDLMDPYAGSCNNMNAFSWWDDQRPYYDSAVNEITISPAAVVFPACPTPAMIDEQSYYQLGDTIYFTTYYRDQLDSQTSTYTLRQPDGSIYATWGHNSNATHYAASYWYWWFDFPNDTQTGLWSFEVLFEGQTYEKTFWIDNVTPTPTSTPTSTATPSPTITPNHTITPTPTSTGTLTVTLTPTGSGTPTFTPTLTSTPAFTPTSTGTPTFTPTATSTSTSTPTATPTPTLTPTPVSIDLYMPIIATE